MTAEANLLIACCRRFLGTNRGENLGDAARDVNWDDAIRLADAHGVAPIVYSALKLHGRITIPGALSALFQANALHNLALTAELLKILDQFATDGITAIPLKGPLLAFQAYGDLSLRVFSDLDLLVSRDDVPRAWKVLAANGYRVDWALPSSHESAYLKIREQELPFVKSDGTVVVDLHWGFLPEHWGASALEDAVSRVQSVTFAGRSVPALSSEDLLLFLGAHGSKHLWERLGWICDFSGVIHSCPDIDWTRFLALASRSVGMRTISLGLLLAEGLLGVTLPEEAIRSMRSDPVALELARDIQNRLFSESPVSTLEYTRFQVRMFEGSTKKIRCLAGLLVMPGEREFRVLQLPPWLYPLYYPLHLARLVVKYTLPKRFRTEI